MKHTLVALAALTAAAGAMAQSSVTLFGVVDASVARVSSAGNDVTGLSSGGLSSSRLGFRGVEDLGGGLAAGFWLEGGLAVDNGTAAGFKFDRRSTVSLSSKDLGELRLGRDKSPAYLNVETFDPFGDSGVAGINGANLIGSASSAAGTAEGSAPKRFSNSVGYVLPKMGGFFGQVAYSFGEAASNIANDRKASGIAMRFGYGNGPLNVALGYGQSRGGTDAVGMDYKSTNLGASYNFGVVKPMVLFATEKGNNKHVDLFALGATMPLGQGELRASYAMFKDKKASNADSSKLALGYGYNLSKRTQLYASVARMSNDDNAKRSLAVSSSSLVMPSVGNGANVTGYEFGVRHSF
jgi:predicted porin